jgi:hypothetical protein
MIIETAEYNTKLIGIFLIWYVKEIPRYIIENTIAYIRAISIIFSFSFLIKTLFFPWKNQLYAYPDKGFDIKHIFDIWIANSISRMVGCIIRLMTLIMGVILIIMVGFIGMGLLLMWIVLPIVFPVGIFIV